MNCIEDILSKHYREKKEYLFPKNLKGIKKIKVYLINIVHIIGTLYISMLIIDSTFDKFPLESIDIKLTSCPLFTKYSAHFFSCAPLELAK